MQPKVSVIIPVYNVEEYLEEALDSVVNQTLREIEIILINDGSTDRSLEIAKSYSQQDQRIKLINQENFGLSVARNTGIETSSGKYLYFLDSDDYLELDTLEKCFYLCEKKDLDLVYIDAMPFLDKISKPFNKEQYNKFGVIKEEKIYTGEEFLYKCLNKNKYTSPVWLYFFKKEILKDLRFYSGIYYEDDLFTPLLLEKIKRMMYISKKFYKRRYRQDSIMTQKISLKHLESRFIIIQEFKKILLEESKQEYRKIIELVLKNEISNLISGSLLGDLEDNKFLKEIIQKEKKYLPIKDKLKIIFKKKYIFYYKLKTMIK